MEKSLSTANLLLIIFVLNYEYKDIKFLNPPTTQIEVPPSARKKFWPSPPSLKLWRAGIQAGEKEGGWGEACLPCLPAGRRQAGNFRPPVLRRRRSGVGSVSARPALGGTGGNAGVGFQIIRAIVARKRFELRSAITDERNE